MKKIVFTYGLIAGVILIIFMFGSYPLWKNGTLTFENGALVGYTSMVVAMSLILFGVKSYRDDHLGGSITFGKGLQVGLLITLLASVGYSVGWEFYQYLLAPDFIEKYASFYISKAKARGASEIDVQKLVTEMDQMKVMYKNPFLRFGMTLTEVLPVGIVISLISAALLRKKNFLTSQPIPQ